MRQIQRRFGTEWKDPFAALLDQESDSERLALIGEWIIDCESAEALLAQFRK